MNQQAPLRGSPVEQVLATTQKKTTKTIRLTDASVKPLTALAFTRNAAVGMALIYLEQLDSIWRPLAFSARNAVLYLTALLHIFAPLLGSWFATHWNERIETAMWGGSASSNAISFMAAWLIMVFMWSIAWLALRSLSQGVLNATEGFSSAGKNRLSAPQNGTRKKS